MSHVTATDLAATPAYQVPCPKCGAGAGFHCSRPNGDFTAHMPQPHVARTRLAEKETTVSKPATKSAARQAARVARKSRPVGSSPADTNETPAQAKQRRRRERRAQQRAAAKPDTSTARAKEQIKGKVALDLGQIEALLVSIHSEVHDPDQSNPEHTVPLLSAHAQLTAAYLSLAGKKFRR